MTDSLYERDVVLWSEDQARALRDAARSDSTLPIDWENVAEEIEDMGNNVVRGVASHLVQAILHDLKAEAWPLSRDVPHWRAEARGHRDEAREAYTPSMKDRPELDVSKLYRRALFRMPDALDGLPRTCRMPDTCPVTLDELLSDEAAAFEEVFREDRDILRALAQK